MIKIGSQSFMMAGNHVIVSCNDFKFSARTMDEKDPTYKVVKELLENPLLSQSAEEAISKIVKSEFESQGEDKIEDGD